MRQVHEDADGLHEPEQSAADVTVLEFVCQSDAYRNRLNRELAGLSTSLPSMHGTDTDAYSTYARSQRARGSRCDQDIEGDRAETCTR